MNQDYTNVHYLQLYHLCSLWFPGWAWGHPHVTIYNGRLCNKVLYSSVRLKDPALFSQPPVTALSNQRANV